jgi:cytochrome c553
MMAAIISNTALHPRRIPRPGPKRRDRSAARCIPAAAATLAIAFLFGTCNASAGPSSHIAWTPETLALVRSGNATRGGQLAAGCGACHGSETAPAVAPYPGLAGQDAAYLYKQLRDFKDGTRSGTLMRSFASALSDQDMADIAAYYAVMPPVVAEDPPALAAAPSLALYGDGTRLIPACNSCHGYNGAGNPRSHGMPVLAGQTAQYLIATLLLYNGAFRENDVYQVMRHIAGQLTIEEIKSLGLYYASQGTE